MKEFKSAFRPSIMEYLEFRSAMGYSNEHEQQLQHFDRYCYEHCPEQTELTKEVVRGWFYDEIARGRSCLSSKATAIRLFAKYLGVSAYILPMSCVPKTPDYLPYILTDSELAALFHAADTMEYKNDPFFRETASVLLRLLYSCGLDLCQYFGQKKLKDYAAFLSSSSCYEVTFVKCKSQKSPQTFPFIKF